MNCRVASLLQWILIGLAITAQEVQGDAADDIKNLQDKFWEFRMRGNPTTSTYDGMYKYNDLMESFDVDDFDVSRNKTLGFMTTLKSINTDGLLEHDKVNYDILADTLQTYLDGNLWARYGALTPINFLGGIQLFGGPSFPQSSARGDFENYIARLHAVQKQVDEMIASCRLAISLNRTLHNVSMARVPEQIDRKIFDDPEQSPYYNNTFMVKLNNSENVQDETVRTDLRSRGRTAVLAYMDAFRSLKNFIVNEYMPNTRTEWGVYAWDPSHEYYKACLKWHISFEMTPDDVHSQGLREVQRISQSMTKIMKNLNFEGSVSEFFKSLTGDSRFYSNDTATLLKAYNDTVFIRIQPKLGQYFRDIPVVPLKIEASSYDGLGGGYSSATENSPGVFSINLFRPLEVLGVAYPVILVDEDLGINLSTTIVLPQITGKLSHINPFFEMMVLSLHEANPGHHLQQSYSMKADLPDFRRNAMLSFYNVPNWFPFYSAYQEGWGLYSEFLGEEMGLYKDDYEMMGRYSYEILRASRLVVDTGLHYKGWTRDKAIEYLTNHTALGGGSAENEIDRYITWPGQACAYKLGEIKIKELRQKSETELGDKFDIKDFHYLILQNGGMPMSVLETLVNHWIEETKAKQPTSAASTTIPSAVAYIFACLCTIIIKHAANEF